MNTTIPQVNQSDLFNMLPGLVVYKAGNTYFAVYYFGIGERSLVYEASASPIKAMNAAKKALKGSPNMSIATPA